MSETESEPTPEFNPPVQHNVPAEIPVEDPESEVAPVEAGEPDEGETYPPAAESDNIEEVIQTDDEFSPEG